MHVFVAEADTSLYFPTSHAVHACDPLTSLYVPRGQAVQFCPASEVYPALHEQSSICMLPGKENEFKGQV
eukprot:597361-Hanusia_phi.AAC.3